MRVTLGGAEVDLFHADEVDERILAALRDETERPLFVASANLDHLHHFGLDSGREGAFDPGRGGADWLVLLDGMPLVWTARRLTGVAWEQLAGSDLLPDLLRTAARARARVGFLGGTPGQHQLLATALADRFATVDVAGFWAPDRDVVEDAEASAALAEEIATAEVDLLVVGLGKPRQEEWLLRHGAATGARAAVAFGAATDFLAGTVTRAPARLRALGLEWLYRLLREPGRLARRYLVQGPSSLVRLLGQSRTEELAAAGRQARPAPVIATPGLWRRRIGRALAAADVGVIALASYLAYWLRNALGEAGVVRGFENELPTALAVIPLWLLIFHYAGAYRPEVLNTGGDAFRRFVAGAFGGLFALGFVSFLLNLSLARLYVGFLFAFVLVLGGLVRVGVRRYLRTRRGRGRLQQNVLVVGADEDAVTTARAIAADEIGGYRPVGFLTDELPVGTGVAGGLQVLGRPADVLDIAYDVRAGLVLVSPTGVPPGTLQDVTLALEGSPVDLAVAPSLFQVVSRRVTVESVANVAILHVDQIRLERGKAALKRTLDLVVAGVALVVTLPVLAVVLVAIRLDSRGPVLFRQVRVGRDGREFTVLKLRTMVADAHRQRDELAHLNEADGPLFKIRDDPRITRVGRVLRTWSLDELPQLVNVLRGDMSLVGPRPALPEEVEKYTPWQMRRLRVRPGITGVWQVSGRSDVPFDEAVRMDLFYIENWSLGTDLFLLGKTLLAVLGRQGAY
jgi:exopolysaccharide biosynthesis polyprenyl glycosylphosphotransferase